MKPLSQSPLGSRIASVHNGSSLFTGDAGGGESNIRRYIIENDLLETLIQLPNNLFYNTGITTYIWVLSNHKAEHRKGKVQLIDASNSFGKLRKNLGNKNCELKPEHITEILKAHTDFSEIKKQGDEGLAVKIFDNSDFGYYKVQIERPSRIKAQFTDEGVAKLRFEKSLKEPMEWAFITYGERVYSELSQLEEDIIQWCEKNEIDLNAKKRKALCSSDLWEKHKNLVTHAQSLLKEIGEETFMDFNLFQIRVEREIKKLRIKLTPAEKKLIYGAISSYDEKAERVIKKRQKLSGEKLENLLECLGCTVEQLPDYGYFPGGKKEEYIIYESDSDLRESESIPLKETIHEYFLREVKPHVEEAWIDLEKTKIGYEISFNKYFYQHKPLRSMEEVSREILALEKENEGLILEILGVGG